ncbi:17888_t:CDS:2, partial [Cetraspora pellucida]
SESTNFDSYKLKRKQQKAMQRAQVYLPLLETDKYFEESFMGIDFTYGHPYIDNSGYKILLDRD